MVVKKQNGKKNGVRPVQRTRVRRRNGQGRMPRVQENVLIPSGVNNRATVPVGSQTYTLSGEEVVSTYIAPAAAVAGTKMFNVQVSHNSVARLGLLSGGFQRIKWHTCHLHLVALNGSTTTSGYTAGFFEDPQIAAPPDGSAVIPVLTALRTTAVRQNWVESTTGMILKLADLPEMYTTLGSDIRRFAIGRYVAALTGPPGTNTTFQLMLKYHVTLSVPQVALAREIVGDTFTVTADVSPGTTGRVSRTNAPPLAAVASTPVSSTSPVPPVGEWLCPGGSGFMSLRAGAAAVVFDPTGEGLDAWDSAVDVMDLVRTHMAWRKVYSIIVGAGVTSWDDVLYRTSEAATPTRWTTSQLTTPLPAGVDGAGQAWGFSVPANFAGFLPSPYPSSPSAPNSWPQTSVLVPIIVSGSVLLKVGLTTNADIERYESDWEQRMTANRIQELENCVKLLTAVDTAAHRKP